MTRRFDLVTLDLDGTLLPDTTAFAAALTANGRAADVEASDERFFAGEISLENCFWEQWAWIKELTLADVHRGLRKASWLPGIVDGVRRLRAAGMEVRLLTDQPSIVTDFLGRWGLIDAISSPCTIKEGRVVDIDARFDKWANLEDALAAARIDPARVCHVGNGRNDVPVWANVGAGVAAFAPSEVARHATVDVGRPESLDAVVDAILALPPAPSQAAAN